MLSTSDSHKLQQYVQHINSVPSLNTYSPDSVKMMKTIYDQAVAASKQPVSAQITSERFSSESSTGSLYGSVDHTIRASIQASNKYSINAVLTIGKRTYNMFFVFPSQSTTISNSVRGKHFAEVRDFLKRAHIWLLVASHYASPQCSSEVDVYLYMTPHKKVLPTSDEGAVSQVHINTALTTQCSQKTEIVLFRREEVFKVFVHESCHNLGLDFSGFPGANEMAKQVVAGIFPIQSELCIYESYCEMWAELVNIVIADIVAHPRRRGFETAWPAIVRNINVERRFTMFQVAKLLTHNNMGYADLMKPGNLYREKTEAFCYFVLKSIMLFHCDDFLAWCFRNNVSGHGVSLQFNQANAKKYVVDLIASHYKSPEYVEALNKTHEHFVKNRARLPALIRNTMRMTIIE
jgi:hypothetical protein